MSFSVTARFFLFFNVIARLDRAICLSPPSDFPDTPVKPEYDNKKRHHPTGPFLPLPGLLFFMSLFGFLFYVIARLLFYLCHCPAWPGNPAVSLTIGRVKFPVLSKQNTLSLSSDKRINDVRAAADCNNKTSARLSHAFPVPGSAVCRIILPWGALAAFLRWAE